MTSTGMEWLNYHHLRYFWTVAREGSLARAAERLNVSAPSISEQIRELEGALGEPLFRREGRNNRLTDVGQLVFGYAEEIFALGGELLNAVKQRPGSGALRFTVGVVDSIPKLIINEILKPVFSMPTAVHVVCREGRMEDLLIQLAAHRLDLVLSDETASNNSAFKTFGHLLGEAGSTFCAERRLATRLRRGFPKSLDGAPALLPAGNTSLRRSLDLWFGEHGVRPQVVAECEDLALMKVMAAEGRGFIAVPDITMDEAAKRYGFRVIGSAASCRIRLHAITAERRINHPAATLITESARNWFRAA